MTRTTKEVKKDKTVGLCVICEKYIANGHYSFKKIDGKLEPVIICEWCNHD